MSATSDAAAAAIVAALPAYPYTSLDVWKAIEAAEEPYWAGAASNAHTEAYTFDPGAIAGTSNDVIETGYGTYWEWAVASTYPTQEIDASGDLHVEVDGTVRQTYNATMDGGMLSSPLGVYRRSQSGADADLTCGVVIDDVTDVNGNLYAGIGMLCWRPVAGYSWQSVEIGKSGGNYLAQLLTTRAGTTTIDANSAVSNAQFATGFELRFVLKQSGRCLGYYRNAGAGSWTSLGASVLGSSYPTVLFTYVRNGGAAPAANVDAYVKNLQLQVG